MEETFVDRIIGKEYASLNDYLKENHIVGYVEDEKYSKVLTMEEIDEMVFSRPLKDALLINSQQINVRFALRYLQIFVPLRLKTCRLYDKQDLSPTLIVQFVGRPTELQTSLVSARRQD